MPSGELNTEGEQIRDVETVGSWGKAPGEAGHKQMGRDFLFSSCSSGLRNALGWQQS